MVSQIRMSVRLSVTWVDQSKTVEARIVQFSPYSSPHPSSFCRISFIQKFEWDPPSGVHQTRVGNLTVVACMKFNTWHLHSLDGAVIVRHGVCTYFFTNSAEFTWSAKLLHYFAINDIHAEIYSAVVYFSDSVLNQIFFAITRTPI